MLTLLGFVKEGIHDFADAWKQLETKCERFWRRPKAISVDKYVGSKPSTQTTTLGLVGSA